MPHSEAASSKWWFWFLGEFLIRNHEFQFFFFSHLGYINRSRVITCTVWSARACCRKNMLAIYVLLISYNKFSLFALLHREIFSVSRTVTISLNQALSERSRMLRRRHKFVVVIHFANNGSENLWNKYYNKFTIK